MVNKIDKGKNEKKIINDGAIWYHEISSSGGSVAINKSHINLNVIQKQFHNELLVHFSRKPRHGQLDVLNSIVKHSTLIKLPDLLTGRSLIYRHQKTGTMMEDEILFYIVPKNDVNRRTNRLRLILPVVMMPQEVPFIKVTIFEFVLPL